MTNTTKTAEERAQEALDRSGLKETPQDFVVRVMQEAEQRGYERGLEEAMHAVAATPCLVDPDGPEPEEERAAHNVRNDAWEAIRNLKPTT